MQLRFDALKVAAVLDQNPQTKSMARRLRRIKDLGSIQHDLDMASDALRVLVDITSGILTEPVVSLDDNMSTLHGALAQRAIMLYARATDTTGNGRGKFEVRRYYDNNQMLIHHSIMAVRNASTAHIDKDALEEPWEIDELFIDIDAEGQTFRFTTNPIHYNFRGKILKGLMLLIPIALKGLLNDRSKTQEAFYIQTVNHESAFMSALEACNPMPVKPVHKAHWKYSPS